MIDERYTPKLKAEYPAAAAPQLPRHPAVQRLETAEGVPRKAKAKAQSRTRKKA
jgi:hypothetical protein